MNTSHARHQCWYSINTASIMTIIVVMFMGFFSDLHQESRVNPDTADLPRPQLLPLSSPPQQYLNNHRPFSSRAQRTPWEEPGASPGLLRPRALAGGAAAPPAGRCSALPRSMNTPGGGRRLRTKRDYYYYWEGGLFWWRAWEAQDTVHTKMILKTLYLVQICIYVYIRCALKTLV